MEGFKGTPGPLKVTGPYTVNGSAGSYQVEHGNDGECVAEIVHDHADAILFAAAPDMLGALSGILDATKGAAIGSAIYNIHMLCYQVISKSTTPQL